MYLKLFSKFLKSSKSRFSLIAGSVLAGTLCVLIFLSGINAVLTQSNRQQWSSFSSTGNYPADSALYDPKMGPAPEDNYTNYVRSLENYGAYDARTDSGKPTIKYRGSISVHYLRAVESTPGAAPKMPWIPMLHEGEFFLSPAVAKLYEQYKSGALTDLRLIEVFSDLGDKYLGLLPLEMTPTPDDKIVVKYYSKADEQRFADYETSMNQVAEQKLADGDTDSISRPFYLVGSQSFRYTKLIFDPNVTKDAHPRMDTAVQFVEIVAILGLLFPVCLLISISTGMGAKQREQRFAAMRLVGATKGQVSKLMLIETVAATVLGLGLGFAVSAGVQPLIRANFTLSGKHFWPQDFVVLDWQISAVIIGALLLTIWVNIRSMRKINISPLGIVNQSKVSKNPRFWGVIPLILGIALTVYIVLFRHYDPMETSSAPNETMSYLVLAFVLLLFGILFSGSFLILQFSKLFSKRTNSALVKLATARWAFMPRVVFKSVGGVIVALFIGSFVYQLLGNFNKIINSGPKFEGMENPLAEFAQIGTLFLAITMGVAVVSLAVSTLSGLMDRKESFASLNLNGMAVGELKRLVLVESALPMCVSIVLSCAGGFAISNAFITSMASDIPELSNSAQMWIPSWEILALMAGSLLVALFATWISVSPLKSVINPQNNLRE